METRYFYILRYLLALTDIALINLCFFIGLNLSNKTELHIDPGFYKANLIICNLIWMLCTSIYRLYTESSLCNIEYVYKATWRSVALHLFLFLFYLFFSNQTDFPRQFLLVFYVNIALGFIISRLIGTAIISFLSHNDDLRKAVAVLGMNEGALRLGDYLLKQSSLKFAGYLDQGLMIGNTQIPTKTISPKEQLRIAAESGIEEVFISVNADRMNDLTELIKEGEKNCIRLKFVPDLSALEANFRFDRMGNFTVLSPRKEPLEYIGNRVKKRLFDIAVSLFVIVFIFSWLYPLLALIIKIQSPGPVFFAQQRSGRNNKPFWCYKFRSMRMNADSDMRQATLNDDRITHIGRFMRKTSLDEFPQFFNVLMGYMSIIGPRPHMLAHTGQYSKIIDKYMVRHFLKPGISGWAQINGYRGETKETWQMEKRVEHDIWYMENWSVALDVKIMFFTIINVFRGEKNAY
jgi:putative colanic acid biosynthesis UDP-glucose lipid carrier transferase